PPLVPRAVVDEHVDTVRLLDLEPGREHLESALARPSLARDEHPVALGQDGRLVGLVVPLRRMARPRVLQVARAPPRHALILARRPAGGGGRRRAAPGVPCRRWPGRRAHPRGGGAGGSLGASRIVGAPGAQPCRRGIRSSRCRRRTPAAQQSRRPRLVPRRRRTTATGRTGSRRGWPALPPSGRSPWPR